MRLFDAPRCSRGSRSCPPTGSAWRASSSWASPSQEPTAADGFELDLSTSDAHKTAAIFGPSTTPEPAAACALLRAWLAAAGLGGAAAAQPYVFVLGSCRCDDVDHAKPLGAALDRARAGGAQAPGGRALRAQGPTLVLHHLPVLSDAISDEVLKKALWRTPCATRRLSRARRRTTRSAPIVRGRQPCRFRTGPPHALSADDAQAEQVRVLPHTGSTRASRPARTTRRTSWGPCWSQ